MLSNKVCPADSFGTLRHVTIADIMSVQVIGQNRSIM